MSNYQTKAKHPETGVEHDVTMLDDYFGQHIYGVRFPDGSIFREDVVFPERKEKPMSFVDYLLESHWC